MRRALILATILGASGPAHADSFCFHEKGLIGTKAIGYVSTYETMLAEDADLPSSDENNICWITSFDDPVAEGPVRIDDCQNFEHVRSGYVEETGRLFTDEEAKTGHPISDYFTPLVFAAEGKMAALRLKTGEKRWVRTLFMPGSIPQGSNSGVYQGRWAIGHEGGISPNIVYSQARAGTETDPPSYRGPIQNVFLESVLPGQPHAEETLRQMHDARGFPISSGFTYRVTDIVTAPDGGLWFEMEERMALSSWAWPAEVRAVYGNDASRITSDPIRTVYVPFKTPDGTIVSVLTSGFDCGC